MSAQTIAVTVPRAASGGAAPGRRIRGAVTAWYHGAMIVASVVWLIPMLWMLSLSLSDNQALTKETQTIVPQGFTLENLLGVFSVGLTSRWFLNSAIVNVVTTVLTVLLCAMAGYAFARFTFRGKPSSTPPCSRG